MSLDLPRTGNFVFAVSKGNYPNHLIRCLEARGNWMQAAEEDCLEEGAAPVIDFYWRQVNLGFSGYDKVDKRVRNHT